MAMARPRVGFLGVDRVGRRALQAIVGSGAVEVAAIADPSPATIATAARLVPGVVQVATLDDILRQRVDGVVIATPSALHAEPSIEVLEAGAAVYCVRPIGRTEAEVRAVLERAREVDRLLAMDLPYRFIEGMRRIRELVLAGDLGRVYAADLVFHNAYGPDEAWRYDPSLAGGGCMTDLGLHLIDLGLWTMDFPEIERVSAKLFADGTPPRPGQMEDYALAKIELGNGSALRLACSWKLHAGRDAIISASFFGTEGGAAFRNVGGSFGDFTAERYRGTERETLAAPPDAWSGRAAADWAMRLAAGERYDPAAERLLDLARVLDRIYGR
jgi:predicted dehydrogenase